MSVLNLVFSAVSVIVGILAIAIPIWRSRQRYALRWTSLPPKSMMEIADQIATAVSIAYEGRSVSNLIRYEFILHNCGFAPLDQDGIVEPVTWRGIGPILSAKVIATEPPVDLQLMNDGTMLKITWILFNQRCKAVIEVLCEESTARRSSADERGSISGQIRNIPEIEEKQIWWRHEDEILRQIQSNLAMQAPSVRIIGKLFANKWLLRVSTWVFYGYLVVAAAMFVWLIFANFNAPPILSAAAIFAVVAITVSLLYRFLRNPYASILRKTRTNHIGT